MFCAVLQHGNVRGIVRGDIRTAHLCQHQVAPQWCWVSDCRLLRLIALGLGLDAAFFDASFSAATSNVRVIHYLPGEHSAADGIFGVGGSTEFADHSSPQSARQCAQSHLSSSSISFTPHQNNSGSMERLITMQTNVVASAV